MTWLGELGGPRVIAALEWGLDDSDRNIRKIALESLIRLDPAGAVSRLLRCLNSLHQDVRSLALASLFVIDPGKAHPFLLRSLDDPRFAMQPGDAARLLVRDTADHARLWSFVERVLESGGSADLSALLLEPLTRTPDVERGARLLRWLSRTMDGWVRGADIQSASSLASLAAEALWRLDPAWFERAEGAALSRRLVPEALRANTAGSATSWKFEREDDYAAFLLVLPSLPDESVLGYTAKRDEPQSFRSGDGTPSWGLYGDGKSGLGVRGLFGFESLLVMARVGCAPGQSDTVEVWGDDAQGFAHSERQTKTFTTPDLYSYSHIRAAALAECTRRGISVPERSTSGPEVSPYFKRSSAGVNPAGA